MKAKPNTNAPKRQQPMTPDLIAPCGMNCGICLGYLREKNPCPGCNGPDFGKPKTRFACRIKTCEEPKSRNVRFCCACAQFPCARLKHLDKRYRTKYGMSMLENLENIRKLGLRKFVAQERIRWKCPSCGATICVHRENCLYCNYIRS